MITMSYFRQLIDPGAGLAWRRIPLIAPIEHTTRAFALGSSAVVKVLGQIDMFEFLVLWGKSLSSLKRFFGNFPQPLFAAVFSQFPAVLWGKWLLGSPNCSLHLSSSLLLDSVLRELSTSLIPTLPFAERSIMSSLLGYSLHLFLLSKHLRPTRTPTYLNRQHKFWKSYHHSH